MSRPQRLWNLLEVTFLPVAESQCDAQGHETDRGDQKDDHAFADGALALSGGCLGGTVAHGTSLAEGRDRGQQKSSDDQWSAKSHFTPSERMRSASGKKIIIKAKHNTREAMVSHFMRETSNFMCMK